MITLLSNLLVAIGAALCPLGLMVLLIWFVVSVVMPANRRLTEIRLLRTTPCDRCHYFNPSDVELRCAVQPSLVLTHDANQCADFESSAPAPHWSRLAIATESTPRPGKKRA